MAQKKLLFVFGTRPEAIKLAPLIKIFDTNDAFKVSVCVTAQHRQMLDQVLDFFKIKPDHDLNLMQPNQSLEQLTANALIKVSEVLDKEKPDLVFVQGDTTSVLAASLAAFYKRIGVVHIEAGLRSFNKNAPYPEEINRVLTSRMTDFHFAPTEAARKNLAKEAITENIYVVGNTVIDALLSGLEIIEKDEIDYRNYFPTIDFSKKIILITCHRRESFGEPFKNICAALNEIAELNPGFELVYPVHLNPNIKNVAYQILQRKNIKLIETLEYPQLIWLMKKSFIILTDSGGIQEEAPALGKPVLVLRDVTERMEGIEAGNAKLVGTNREIIVREAQKLINDPDHYQKMSLAANPYGDGTTSLQILKILENHFFNN